MAQQYLRVPVGSQAGSMIYVSPKPGLITADGEVTEEGTKKFLQNYMTELHAFIVRVLTVLPRKV